MQNPRLILVTGAAGAIGGAVAAGLSTAGYRVRGFDRAPMPSLRDAVVGDIAEAAVVQQAADGVDTIIHLAAEPDDADFMTVLLPANIIGVYNVFDAARRQGVRRLVCASSCQVNAGQLGLMQFPVQVTDAPTPTNHYAVTKLFTEDLGRMYARSHGLSVINARIGFLPRTAEQLSHFSVAGTWQDLYLGVGDAVRFFSCCIEAGSEVSYETLFCTSRQRHGICDLESARASIGYVPQQAYPEGILPHLCQA